MPVVDSSCTHRWDIESASGPTSLGRCTYCGAEKRFRNHIDTGQKLFALSAGDKRNVEGYFRDAIRARRRQGKKETRI